MGAGHFQIFTGTLAMSVGDSPASDLRGVSQRMDHRGTRQWKINSFDRSSAERNGGTETVPPTVDLMKWSG